MNPTSSFKELGSATVPIIDISTASNFIQQIHLKVLQQYQVIMLYEKMCMELLESKDNASNKEIMIRFGLVDAPTVTPDNVKPMRS